MPSRRYAFFLLLVAAVAIAGCSNTSKQSPAPTTPTTGMVVTPGATIPIDLMTDTPMGLAGAGFDKPAVGVVKDLTGTCPTVTFALAGVTIHVGEKTVFDGGKCEDLENGVRAGAIGSKNTDGTVNAARVKIAPALPPPPPPVVGVVSSLTGTCPALSFKLDGTEVHSNADTDFDGGECADLKEGGRAAAVGRIDSAGVMTAKHVRVGPPPMVQVMGLVADLTGDCPAVRFVLSNATAVTPARVQTSAKTRFEGGTCGDLKAGLRAGAVGVRNADGVLAAVGVKIAVPR